MIRTVLLAVDLDVETTATDRDLAASSELAISAHFAGYVRDLHAVAVPPEVADLIAGGALSLVEARDDEEDTLARAAEEALHALDFTERGSRV